MGNACELTARGMPRRGMPHPAGAAAVHQPGPRRRQWRTTKHVGHLAERGARELRSIVYDDKAGRDPESGMSRQGGSGMFRVVLPYRFTIRSP